MTDREDARKLFQAGLQLGKAHKALAEIRELAEDMTTWNPPIDIVFAKIARIAREALDE